MIRSTPSCHRGDIARSRARRRPSLSVAKWVRLGPGAVRDRRVFRAASSPLARIDVAHMMYDAPRTDSSTKVCRIIEHDSWLWYGCPGAQTAAGGCNDSRSSHLPAREVQWSGVSRCALLLYECPAQRERLAGRALVSGDYRITASQVRAAFEFELSVAA